MTNQSPMLRRNVKFDTILKDIDEEYRTTLINFAKYKLVMLAMTKLMEMETTKQNKVALYLFNLIKKLAISKQNQQSVETSIKMCYNTKSKNFFCKPLKYKKLFGG